MARGYSNTSKYRGGNQDRGKKGDGPGKNARHGKGGHHSQKPKGQKRQGVKVSLSTTTGQNFKRILQ